MVRGYRCVVVSVAGGATLLTGSYAAIFLSSCFFAGFDS